MAPRARRFFTPMLVPGNELQGIGGSGSKYEEQEITKPTESVGGEKASFVYMRSSLSSTNDRTARLRRKKALKQSSRSLLGELSVRHCH